MELERSIRRGAPMSDDLRGRALVNKVCALMLQSSCFGREVCPDAPCACAQSLIDMIGRAAVEAYRKENERLRARLQPDPDGPPVDQERDHLAEQCAELLRENEDLRAAVEAERKEIRTLRNLCVTQQEEIEQAESSLIDLRALVSDLQEENKRLRAAVEAERKRIADRLDGCFEPTSPAIAIGSELAAVACEIIREARKKP